MPEPIHSACAPLEINGAVSSPKPIHWIYLTYKNSKYIKRVANITLFLSILSFGFISHA